MRKVWIGACAFLLIVAAGVAGGVWLARQAFDAPGPLGADSDIVVPAGTAAQLGEALAAAGLLADPRAFRLAAWWTRADGAVHAGEFSFPAHASLRAVLLVLRRGRPVQHRLTIPEGLTSAQVAQLVEKNGLLTGRVAPPPEGAVLPQTYAFERGTTREALLGRTEQAMDKALAEAWAGRAKGLPLANARELLIIASIVEKETARAEERPMVAAVYLNRLRKGMRLQADPTVAYAVSGGERAPSHADLDSPSPYNTYRVAALPPGPIANPGVASLSAAAHPAASEALYFVADGSGGHAFAATLEEHNRNVGKLRAGKSL